jgi:hypothetical protein
MSEPIAAETRASLYPRPKRRGLTDKNVKQFG